MGTLAGLSQPRTETASHEAARRAFQGASSGTFFAMAFMRAMACPALKQGHRVDAGDVAPVAPALPAGGQDIVALDEGGEDGHPHLLGQCPELVVFGTDEAAAHVDGHPTAGRTRPDPAPDAVTRFEDDDGSASLAEPSRCGQPGQAGADDTDIGLSRCGLRHCPTPDPGSYPGSVEDGIAARPIEHRSGGREDGRAGGTVRTGRCRSMTT